MDGQEGDLIRVDGNYGLITPQNNFVVFSEGAVEKMGSVDSITVYEPRAYTPLLCVQDLDREESHLRWAFQKNMFNFIYYLNQKSEISSSWTGYISGMNDLEKCLGIMRRDIEGGAVPARYGVFLSHNTSGLRKFGGR